ncbi:MAG: hypothetical protein WDN66_03185 [Candidatus Saccharibacteria bacterium]
MLKNNLLNTTNVVIKDNRKLFVGNVKFIHSSFVLYSSSSLSLEQKEKLKELFDRDSNQTFSELQLIKYEPNVTKDSVIELDVSSYKESFP